jgi:hypothetical protein
MKKITVAILFFTCIGNLYSQDKTKSDIQIPGSPGMSIIGVQNIEIAKPGNYTGLYSSLISPIVSNNGTIPTDLSLEFSPYYLESRDVTVNELSRIDLYRDLKFSIASTNVINADSSSFSRMGLGFKTNLLSGIITVLSKNETTLAIANDVNTVIDKINSGIYGELDTANISDFTNHINKKDKKVKKEIEKIINVEKGNKEVLIVKLEEYRDKVEQLINVDASRWDYSLRTGSFLEFAGAVAIDFPDNRFNYSMINRWGIWLNYTYRLKNRMEYLDLGAILRISNYSFDPTVTIENEVLFGDIGASINIKMPGTKFIVSGEFIGKFGFTDLVSMVDKENQLTFKSVTENKWNLSVGYQITNNVIWNMNLSEIKGNSDYLKKNTMQFLMGISAAIVPMKK